MKIVELMPLHAEEDHAAWLVFVGYGSSYDAMFTGILLGSETISENFIIQKINAMVWHLCQPLMLED